VSRCDTADRRIVEQALAVTERGECLDRDVVAARSSTSSVVLEVRVRLDLVDHRHDARLADDAVEVLRVRWTRGRWSGCTLRVPNPSCGIIVPSFKVIVGITRPLYRRPASEHPHARELAPRRFSGPVWSVGVGSSRDRGEEKGVSGCF
jgi:hypothetical protein